MIKSLEKFTSGRGGKRQGAGRPKGTKITNNETTFYARCTKEEKLLLSEYLEFIRKKEC